MKRITFSLDEENYNYLKKNRRGSLSFTLNELITAIRKADIKIEPTIISNNLINTTNLPAGTKITATSSTLSAPELTPYQRLQKRAKELLGRYLLLEEWRLMDYESDHDYYDKKYETPIMPGSTIRCVYIFNLPEERQEQYLQETKEYDSKHPFNSEDYDEYDYEPKNWEDRVVFPHDSL